MIEILLSIRSNITDRNYFNKIDNNKFVNYLKKFDYEEIGKNSKNNKAQVFHKKSFVEAVIVVYPNDHPMFVMAMKENLRWLERDLDLSQLQILCDILSLTEEKKDGRVNTGSLGIL